MRKTRRKLIALIATMVLISLSTNFSLANSDITGVNETAQIQPYWTGLSMISPRLAISKTGVANPTISGTTYPNEVDYVSIALDLKRESGSSWITEKSWNQNKTINLCAYAFDETYSVPKGYIYKYTATIKSYKNNALVDSVTFDSNLVVY